MDGRVRLSDLKQRILFFVSTCGLHKALQLLVVLQWMCNELAQIKLMDLRTRMDRLQSTVHVPHVDRRNRTGNGKVIVKH